MVVKRIKRLIRSFLDRSWVVFCQYTMECVHAFMQERSLYDMAWQRARSTSLDYVDQSMPGAMIFRNRMQLWEHVLRSVAADGLAAEFGVYKGESISCFAMHFAHIYGFDSFLGLREDWSGHEFAKGAFDLKGVLPHVPENVSLVSGWFDQTIPEFLQRHDDSFKFVHIDCDTYEATTIVLSLIGSRLKPGAVLIFDEYIGFPGWRNGEYLAWQECVAKFNIKYKYVAYSEQQVALCIL